MYRNQRLEECISELQYALWFGGSSSGDADVTSRVEPWEAAKDHIERLYNFANTAYDDTDKNPYPGEFHAGENEFDLLARDQIVYAAEQMNDDALRTRTLGRKTLAGEFLEPSTNPILQASINAAVERAESALLEDVIPQVLDIAVKSGAYSGTATDIIIDRALEGFSRETLRATTGIYYENYTRERGMQPQGVELLKVAEVMEFERAKLHMSNADILRQLEQIELDNALQHFEDELKSHWRGQQEYMSIMTGGGFHADTSSDPSKKKNIVGSALQGAVGGASLGATVGGGPGAIVGGILGGVAGLLG